MNVILTPQIRENLHEPGKNKFVEENGTRKPSSKNAASPMTTFSTDSTLNSDQFGPNIQSIKLLFLRCEITEEGFHGVLFYSAWVLPEPLRRQRQAAFFFVPACEALAVLIY